MSAAFFRLSSHPSTLCGNGFAANRTEQLEALWCHEMSPAAHATNAWNKNGRAHLPMGKRHLHAFITAHVNHMRMQRAL